MSFDPETWLPVAGICCSNIPGVSREALLRTAVNRAYYAALLALRDRIELAQGPGSVPAWGTHNALKQAVGTAGASFRDVDVRLSRLRRARERADYVLAADDLELGYVWKLVDQARWLIRNRIKALPEAEFRRLRVPRG